MRRRGSGVRQQQVGVAAQGVGLERGPQGAGDVVQTFLRQRAAFLEGAPQTLHARLLRFGFAQRV